jgi:RNA polymerase sigma-70 factor, ECF subfamily
VRGPGQPVVPIDPVVPVELAVPSTETPADEEIAGFYAEQRPRIYGFLVGGCGCPGADADDIIQDTIMVIRARYWPKVRTLDKPAAAAYWFKTAERRYRKSRRRQAGRIIDGDPSERLVSVAHPGDQFAAIDRREALEAALRQLPQRQRQVLWLRGIADFSEAETAEILCISPGSVKTHHHHAKKRMQELLRKDGTTWEAEVP